MSSRLILTADPDFTGMALAELRQAQPGAQVLATLAPGVLLIQIPQSFFDLAVWQRHPPIFVRHICPAGVTAPLAGTAADLARLQQVMQDEVLDLIEPDLPFSVQTRLFDQLPYKPFDVNTTLSQDIQQTTGAPLDVRAPEQILSVVAGVAVAYLGLSPAAYNLSDWAGGVRRFAREKGQISRAEFKLLEALEVFSIELPPYGVALDLGAAPGGWTRILRQRGQYVTAVDPADLHLSLKADTGIRHLRMTAEAYLANDPDQFDLIVNDMRLDGRDSARLMAAYAGALYRHGIALMTLKLPADDTAAGGRTHILDHSFTILRQAYDIAGARHLFHNRSEITLFLKLLAQS